MKLADLSCVSPTINTRPLAPAPAAELSREIPGWRLDEQTLTREFRFKNFRDAMAFANQVADIAEAQNHHPDLLISYSRVTLTLTTHKIGGLSQNDFIVAARIDQLPAAAAGAVP